MTQAYLTAIRKKFRFPSPAGLLNLEQIWDLPLQHKTGLDLDTVARTINSELRSITEESFVVTKTDPRKPELEIKLAIVKDVIATKLAEEQAARDKADRKLKRDKILGALSAAEDRSLQSASKDDLLKQLAALDD